MRVLSLLLLFFSFIAVAYQQSYMAKVLDVIPTGDGRHHLYVVDIPDQNFSWGSFVLKIERMNWEWKNLKIGHSIPLTMEHTASDVPTANADIKEGFFHSITLMPGLSYLGFLVHPVDTVQKIDLSSVTNEGEGGPYTIYSLHLVFSTGKKITLSLLAPIDVKSTAQPGDQVLIAEDFLEREHVYIPNPYGNKRVFQKHWTGPFSNEPLYKRPTYGQVLFNLSRGTLSKL